MPARTALFAAQQAAGGKMIDFSGWDMPVQFSGITAEHQAVRSAAGVFDLGHMGRLTVSGVGSLAFLERQVCRPLADMRPGQVRYGLALAADGTVEDDVLVSRENEHDWHVVVNAGNREKIVAQWRTALPATAIFADITTDQAMIAVQGPSAPGLLARLGLGLEGLSYYAFRDAAWQGVPVRISRTGYTGEDGAELFMPTKHAEDLWRTVVSAGALPCGLGCRDSLRLEAGMPLYGHELDRSITPIEAGLAFAVNQAGGFIGDQAVLRQLSEGAPRRLVGLRCRDKRVPRQGYPVLHHGAQVGVITSGTLSPTLGAAIGMALVPTSLATAGTAVSVDVRGTLVPADIVSLPFYRRAKN